MGEGWGEQIVEREGKQIPRGGKCPLPPP